MGIPADRKQARTTGSGKRAPRERLSVRVYFRPWMATIDPLSVSKASPSWVM